MTAVPSPARSSVLRATAIGTVAILMWATLAPLATLARMVPPFQMVALSFGIAFLIGSLWSLAHGESPFRHFRQPAALWGISVGGLFGFHFLYFLSLRLAPPVEANLINYLWPLLIVLFSALLPGERLKARHVVGALLGLGGTMLLITRGAGLTVSLEHLPGYTLALASAFTWAGYSVLRRRLGEAPTEAVTGFCLATSALAALCHLAWETTVWPDTAGGWAALTALGIGPVGAAFFVWDYGVRHGDIRALGALSYAAPLLSTILLVVFGLAAGHWTVWAACLLIAGGSLLASSDLFRKEGQPS